MTSSSVFALLAATFAVSCAAAAAAAEDCRTLVADINRADSYAVSLKRSIAREQRLIARSRSRADRELHSTALSQDQAELQRVQSRLAKTRNTAQWHTCVSKASRSGKSHRQILTE